MSKYHFTAMNMPWEEVCRIICYGTKNTEILSKKQIITRLYKSFLNEISYMRLRGVTLHVSDYETLSRQARRDFRKMLGLSRNDIEFKKLTNFYEEFMGDYFDASRNPRDNQMYSPISCRFQTYSDQELTYDPIGFYKEKTALYFKRSMHMPFYEDFPLDDAYWRLEDSQLNVPNLLEQQVQQIKDKFDTKLNEKIGM